jgi:hypothetical protein
MLKQVPISVLLTNLAPNSLLFDSINCFFLLNLKQHVVEELQRRNGPGAAHFMVLALFETRDRSVSHWSRMGLVCRGGGYDG